VALVGFAAFFFHDLPPAQIDRREENITLRLGMDSRKVQSVCQRQGQFVDLRAADHHNLIHSIDQALTFGQGNGFF
jgi:hypothetical protein